MKAINGKLELGFKWASDPCEMLNIDNPERSVKIIAKVGSGFVWVDPSGEWMGKNKDNEPEFIDVTGKVSENPDKLIRKVVE